MASLQITKQVWNTGKQELILRVLRDFVVNNYIVNSLRKK